MGTPEPARRTRHRPAHGRSTLPTESSLRGGLFGIAAVTLATVALAAAAAVIALLVAALT